MRALRRYLDARHIKTWVQGAVVTTHPEYRLDVSTATTPVFTLPQLARYILTYWPRWAPKKLQLVTRQIDQLLKA